MRGGGGSFARGDVVDGDLKFPVGVDGGEGGEGDDDADGGALEVEGRSGFGRGRKAVAGLDGKVAGDDALADDVPDAGRREAVACRRWPVVGQVEFRIRLLKLRPQLRQCSSPLSASLQTRRCGPQSRLFSASWHVAGPSSSSCAPEASRRVSVAPSRLC